MVNMVTYCTAANVASFLNLNSFSGSTDPTTTEVEEYIEMNEDYIDRETMHAWRAVTVSQETHHLDSPAYNLRDGVDIYLNHRKITAFSSPTDKLEVWNGSEWEDYAATRTEGRNNDFWIDYEMGIVFIKTFPRTIPRFFSVRVTYRYGEAAVAKDIKKACILLTAADIIETDDRSILFPEGTSNVPLLEKSRIFRERAEKIINANREIKAVAL